MKYSLQIYVTKTGKVDLRKRRHCLSLKYALHILYYEGKSDKCQQKWTKNMAKWMKNRPDFCEKNQKCKSDWQKEEKNIVL